MELVLAAAVIAAVLFAGRKPSAPSSSSSASSATSASGSTTGSLPVPPMLPPGVYPAGTPGAIPIVLFVQGGDNDARLYASPGSYAGPAPPKTKTVWYGPGTRVTFKATVDPSWPAVLQLTAFDHFEGPGGVKTSQNPFSMEIRSTGYVRAVFAWLGQVGG